MDETCVRCPEPADEQGDGYCSDMCRSIAAEDQQAALRGAG